MLARKRRFPLRFLALLLLAAAPFAVAPNPATAAAPAPLPPRPPEAYHWAYDLDFKILFFFRSRGHVKLVIVGDSRSADAVDPRAFYSGASQSYPYGFNFASGGTGFDLHEIVLTEYAVHAPKLEWVVYGMSPRIFNKYYRDGGYEKLIASGGLKYDRANADKIWAVPPPLSWAPANRSEFLKDWGWHEDMIKNAVGTSSQTLVSAAQQGRYELDTDRWDRFEKMLDLFAKRNVKVLGFTPPLPNLLADTASVDKDGTPHATYWALVQSLTELQIKHPNFFFRDMHQGGRHDFTTAEFYDWDHLNVLGSRKLMPRLEAIRKAVDAQPKLDVTPPAVASVTAVGDPGRATVYFTEPIGKPEAEDAANYEIGAGVTLKAAHLADDLRTVTLETSPLAEKAPYSLTVKNVKDRADNVVASAPAAFTFVKALKPGVPSVAKYVWDKLPVGAAPYVDTPAALLTAIPAKYATLTALRIAEADKAAAGDTFLSFDVNYPVRVYVAHDEAVQIKPAWLEPFIWTWDILEIGKDKYRIAWKDFPPRSDTRSGAEAGTYRITLGGNAGPTGHMYFVFVEPMGSVIEYHNPGNPFRPAPGETAKPAPSEPPKALPGATPKPVPKAPPAAGAK